MNKRPIDIMRESAFSFKIESEGDDDSIGETCELNDRLVIITKKSVREVALADQIDPKRENPNIPYTAQKRILDIGSESILLAKTLLTAKTLFKSNFLPSSINTKKAMSLTFDALIDLVDMNRTYENLKADQDKEIEAAQNHPLQSSSLALPSISDVKPRAKSFFQKADHVSQTIIDMIIAFYPIKHPGHFETEVKRLTSIYSQDDNFIIFLHSILPFMKIIRNIRDSLDHRNAKGVSVENFNLNADGTITVPTIAMKFRDTTLEPISLSLYMLEVIENLLLIIENLMAYLCNKHVQPFGHTPIQVMITPEGRRRHKSVQFGYYVNFKGQWTPID